MVILLLRVLMMRLRCGAYTAGYEQGKSDGVEEGKRIALDRLFDQSRDLYPGAARTIQQFLRSSHL